MTPVTETQPAAVKSATLKDARFRIPRPAAHWTPRYIKNRIAWAIWQRKNPSAPWLNADAIQFLDTWVQPGDVIAEFGSGRSTVYFANKVGAGGCVYSIEHHKEWFENVSSQLKSLNFLGSRVRYCKVDEEEAAYVAGASSATVGTLADLVLVDGLFRDACVLWAMKHVKPGGVIAIDNVQWYLPHKTYAPHSIPEDGVPATPQWTEFWQVAKGWRKHWTSNGIHDTAFFFVPK